MFARITAACLLTCEVLFVGAPASAQAPDAPVPLDYFGLHAHRLLPQTQSADTSRQQSPWPSFRFGGLRLWDAYVAWPQLQPHRDSWDFTALDQYVVLASSKGVELALPLGLSPDWASARPQEKSNYALGNAAEPANLNDWRTYVQTVAQRYKGRIRVYELWNEINLKGFFSGDLKAMVELARVAHEEIKKFDPSAILVSPSFTESKGIPLLDQYLSLGGGKYADVIGYHFYTSSTTPEALVPMVAQVKAVLSKHGIDHKALWNTESGWWLPNSVPTQRIGAAGANWLQLDHSSAAAFVARALILGWASGVERFYWYAWDNWDMGLFDAAAREEKPAAKAYAMTLSWLLGTRMKGCSAIADAWVCQALSQDGETIYMAWLEKGPARQWEVPADWDAYIAQSLDGSVKKVGKTLLLDEAPILIRHHLPAEALSTH